MRGAAQEGMDHEEHHNQPGAPEEGGEQQISKPHRIWRRFPNTDTACLKWVMTYYPGADETFVLGGRVVAERDDRSSATTLVGGQGGLWTQGTLETLMSNAGVNLITPYLIQLRMTSPYNILKTVKDYATTNNSNFQPNWLAWFDQKYQYYHCMETEWQIEFNFGVPQSGGSNQANFQNYGIFIFWRYTNEDDPPLKMKLYNNNTIANATQFTSNQVATATGLIAQDTSTTQNINPGSDQTFNLQADDYFRMGGWHHKHVMFSTTHSTRTSIEGKYRFGQCKMDIKTINPGTDAHGNTASTSEGWQQCGSTAIFPENLSVIIVADNAMHGLQTSTITVPMGIRFETEQLIQFKDLRANFKFPTVALANPQGVNTMVNDEVFFARAIS